jgi:hypothetical protein
MLVETLAKHRVVEHEVLPGAAFDIDRALTQFLNGGGQLYRRSLLRDFDRPGSTTSQLCIAIPPSSRTISMKPSNMPWRKEIRFICALI